MAFLRFFCFFSWLIMFKGLVYRVRLLVAGYRSRLLISIVHTHAQRRQTLLQSCFPECCAVPSSLPYNHAIYGRLFFIMQHIAFWRFPRRQISRLIGAAKILWSVIIEQPSGRKEMNKITNRRLLTTNQCFSTI